MVAGSLRNFRVTGLLGLLFAFVMAGVALAVERETASLAYCTSKWGAQPELLALCNEHQGLAKVRYRERLANALDGGYYEQLRTCREQEIDAALDQGLNPADLNWFALEDCFLFSTDTGMRALAEEWGRVDREPFRFECAVAAANYLDDFRQHSVSDLLRHLIFFTKFDGCYYKATANALGYDTDCDNRDVDRSEVQSRPCHDPLLIEKREIESLKALLDEMRTQRRERRTYD